MELELKFLLGMELEWSWSGLPPELPISVCLFSITCSLCLEKLFFFELVVFGSYEKGFFLKLCFELHDKVFNVA